jgi:hypothetical protein
MALFEAGDVVQVDYKSPRLIEEWMQGLRPVGPGDVGVVKYSVHSEAPGYNGNVSVCFPMLGTYGVHSSNLRVVQRAESTNKFVDDSA